jgi:hypothetical protein
MVAPFVLPAIPIATAIGRFAAPYLVKELGKIGANKFVKTYGDEAFTSLNETLTKNTSMVNAEAMPMVNPSFKAPGVIAPDAEEMEREAEKIREMTKPIGFPAEPPIKPDIKTGETTPPKIDIVEKFPAEDKPLPKLPGFGEGDKIDIPIIFNMKDGKPEFKYPTEEEIKEYINEENKFWKENIEKANKENPQYSPKNMPQIVEADKHFGAAAYIFQNYDKSKLIYMSPDEYLSLTKEYRSEEGKESTSSKVRIKNLENILREGGELANIPILYIKKSEDTDTFEVVGQEGNHRAKAFKNLGYDKIPVVIEGSTREIRKKTKDIFPTNIFSFSNYNKDTERYEQYDSVSTKPTDFYDVLTKEKLFKADDVNTQTEKLITGTKDLDVLPEATETVLEAEKAIKQTKKLKENKKIEDYFDGIDELYDNEWYGSTKNIRDFFSSQDPDDIFYTYEDMFFQEYGQTKPIHELFENEYQGGVGDLGNSDAVKVMAGGGMYTYGEFNAPQYYQEYQEKLVEYTRKKLGDEFIGYRLTRKEEMDKYLNVDRSMTGEEEFYTKARSYSLSRSTAEGFKYLWSDYFTNEDGSPRKDLILIETPIEAESLLMRGKSNEKEVVVSGSYLDSDKMNFYDLKGNLLQKAIKGPLAKKTNR